MTFAIIVPNAAQSPGLFPAQNNTNFSRIKTIIAADHIFNDTAAANDGTHLQVTLTNRADPTTVPAGTNSIVYGKTATDLVNELWFYDNVTARQLNWRELSGTVAVNHTTFTTISVIPANVFGYIFLWASGIGTPSGNYIQYGVIISNVSIVDGFSASEKYIDGSGASQILTLGFPGNGESGLNLTVKNTTSPNSFDGTWNYRIFYRTYL